MPCPGNDSLQHSKFVFVKNNLNKIFYGRSKHVDELYHLLTNKQESVLRNIANWNHDKAIYFRICDSLKMPKELALLPLAVSEMNNEFGICAKNKGAWQLQKLNAQIFGLQIEEAYDERLDPMLSAKAALSYLKFLYGKTNSWKKSVNSYLKGMAHANKMRHANKTDTLLFPLLKAYVHFVNNRNAEEEIIPLKKKACKRININKSVHVNQICKFLHLEKEALMEINPLITSDLIIVKSNSIPLYLPADLGTDYASLQDSIYKHERQKYFPETELKKKQKLYRTPGKGYAEIIYKIKFGDSLGKIAQKYKVKSKDLCYWNQIVNNRIYAGKTLRIYVPNSKAVKYKAETKATKIAKYSQGKNKIPKNAKKITYKIKNGDSPYTIAQKYPGVSNRNIMEWNNITDPLRIKPGSVIYIYVKQ